MLVLSRKTGESVLIGDNIVVSIVRVRGNKVRLGIQAPDSVVAKRMELLDVSLLESGTTPHRYEYGCPLPKHPR